MGCCGNFSIFGKRKQSRNKIGISDMQFSPGSWDSDGETTLQSWPKLVPNKLAISKDGCDAGGFSISPDSKEVKKVRRNHNVDAAREKSKSDISHASMPVLHHQQTGFSWNTCDSTDSIKLGEIVVGVATSSALDSINRFNSFNDFQSSISVDKNKSRRKSFFPYPSFGRNLHGNNTAAQVSDTSLLWNSLHDQASNLFFQRLLSVDGNVLESNKATLNLHRTTCFFLKLSNLLLEAVSKLKRLKVLDISGNNVGPIAFRSLILSLLKHDLVEELNVSYNKADSDCAEVIRSLLASTQYLKHLNVSGNPLGKDSLARSLSSALGANEHLVSLNISNCSLLTLHGVFDGYRNGLSLETTALKHLDVSNNLVGDGQQLGSDIALVLDHPKCILKYLNIANVGLNCAGWDAIISGLKTNHSLTEFIAGGASNHINNILKIKDILFINKTISMLNIEGIQIDQPCELSRKNTIISSSNIDLLTDLNLTHVNLSNCQLTDLFVSYLLPKYCGRLSSVVSFNLSYNKELSLTGIKAFQELLINPNTSHSSLLSLTLSGLNLEHVFNTLTDFTELKILNLDHTSFSSADCNHLSKLGSLQSLSINGLPMHENNLYTSILTCLSFHHLSALNLSNCSLTDEGLKPIVDIISQRNSVLQLTHLDISNNELAHGLQHLMHGLLSTSRYPLERLNVSRNTIADDGAFSVGEYISTELCKPMLKQFDISHNCLTTTGILALVSSMSIVSVKMGLKSLDVSSQALPVSEKSFEKIAKAVAEVIYSRKECFWVAGEEVASNSLPFFINLSNLGKFSSIGVYSKLLLHIDHVKTDFSSFNTSASLEDILLIAAGFDKGSNNTSSVTQCGKTAAFSFEQWAIIVGSIAPAWVKKPTEESKIIHLSHLSLDITPDQLKQALEVQAHCSVKDIYFILDPVFHQATDAAWVLFDDDTSAEAVADWYANGKAQICGHYITVAKVPISVLDSDKRISLMVKHEKQNRELIKRPIEEATGSYTHCKLIAEDRAVCLDLWSKR